MIQRYTLYIPQKVSRGVKLQLLLEVILITQGALALRSPLFHFSQSLTDDPFDLLLHKLPTLFGGEGGSWLYLSCSVFSVKSQGVVWEKDSLNSLLGWPCELS